MFDHLVQFLLDMGFGMPLLFFHLFSTFWLLKVNHLNVWSVHRPTCCPWGPSIWSFTKLSFNLLMLTMKNYYCNCRWNWLIFSCSEDLKSKFLACHSLNFYKNHVLLSEYDSATLSLTPSKYWTCLALKITVNRVVLQNEEEC